MNETINNFKDDVQDKIRLHSGDVEVKDVLKKLAKMEGVKEAIDHRKSAKEVLKELEQMKSELLKAERKGVDCSAAKTKVETLMWVIGQ